MHNKGYNRLMCKRHGDNKRGVRLRELEIRLCHVIQNFSRPISIEDIAVR